MACIEFGRDAFEALTLRCDCGAEHRTPMPARVVDAFAFVAFVRDHAACAVAVTIVGRPSRARLVRELSRRPPAASPRVLYAIEHALTEAEGMKPRDDWHAAVAWVEEAKRRRVRS